MLLTIVRSQMRMQRNIHVVVCLCLWKDMMRKQRRGRENVVEVIVVRNIV